MKDDWSLNLDAIKEQNKTIKTYVPIDKIETLHQKLIEKLQNYAKWDDGSDAIPEKYIIEDIIRIINKCFGVDEND